MKRATDHAISLPSMSRIAAAWMLFYAAAVVMYLPYLGAPYFSDDLLFYFISPPAHLIQYFWTPGADPHLYRPGEAIILTLIQKNFGFNTIPIHIVSIAAHASLCCMVWIAAVRLGFKVFAAAVAAILMLVSQIGVAALLGNDSLSQAMGAAFGTLSILLLGCASLEFIGSSGQRVSYGLVTCSALAFFAGIMFKETGLGMFGAVALFAVMMALSKSSWPARLQFMTMVMLPYVFLVIVYFVARAIAGHGQIISGSGPYKISVGSNVIRNLAQFASAAVAPISTVTTALAIQGRELGTLALAGAAELIVGVTVMVGIVPLVRRPIVLVLICCTLTALFPAMILQHVSELYLYNALPFIALLLGLAFNSVWERGGSLRAAAMVSLILLFTGQVLANHQKAALMNANGLAATRLIRTIIGYMKNMPFNGEILLTEGPSSGPHYSVFVLHGLEVVEWGCERLGPMFGRPDVTIRMVDEVRTRGLRADSRRLILRLQNGDLEPDAP
jgi:hypothetical protein